MWCCLLQCAVVWPPHGIHHIVPPSPSWHPPHCTPLTLMASTTLYPPHPHGIHHIVPPSLSWHPPHCTPLTLMASTTLYPPHPHGIHHIVPPSLSWHPPHCTPLTLMASIPPSPISASAATRTTLVRQQASHRSALLHMALHCAPVREWLRTRSQGCVAHHLRLPSLCPGRRRSEHDPENGRHPSRG